MSKSIEHTIFFPHPPQAVWEYLTNAELLSEWLMENDFKPLVGSRFQFRAKPVPALEWDGIANCTVQEIVPLKRLSYSWQSGPGGGVVTIDTLIEWTLTAKAGGTELALRHSGFGAADVSVFTAMNAGWLKNMQKIDDLIKQKRNAAERP